MNYLKIARDTLAKVTGKNILKPACEKSEISEKGVTSTETSSPRTKDPMEWRRAYYTAFEREVIRTYGCLWPTKQKVMDVWEKWAKDLAER